MGVGNRKELSKVEISNSSAGKDPVEGKFVLGRG
jgi:hypothetical protein